MPGHLARYRSNSDSMKGSPMKKFLLAIAAVAGVSAVAFHALAQAPGPHQHHRGGGPIAMIAALQGQLNLNTSQQQQWAAIVAQAQAAKQAAHASFAQLQAATQAELAKSAPDLASLAAQADAIHQQNATAFKSVRDAWLALYATFSADQVAVVRTAMTARLAQMQQWRAKRQQPAPSPSQ
jgi:hypothetical protein